MADPKPFTMTVGPFSGMNDVVSLAAQDAGRAAYLENMYAPSTVIGGDLISRPGFTRYALGTATANLTGMINSIAVLKNAVFSLNGTSTLFLTELSVGDIITVSAITCIIATITSDVAGSAYPSATTTISGTYTAFRGGIIGGQILGLWQHTRTDATYHRFLLVRTTSPLVDGNGVGRYRFFDSSTVTVLTSVAEPPVPVFPRSSAKIRTEAVPRKSAPGTNLIPSSAAFIAVIVP